MNDRPTRLKSRQTRISHFLRVMLAAVFITPTTLTTQAEPASPATAERETIPDNFRRENLVAWCIVPFDSENRTPEARAELLVELGLKHCAYDWRAEHVPTFEREVLAYKEHEIEFSAFWREHDDAFALFEKHDIHPQIWSLMGQPKTPSGASQADKVSAATESMKPLAERCKKAGLQLGLYNHGGWAGEPENIVAVCQALRTAGYADVGVVYNFHHAHDQIVDPDQFAKSLQLLKPFLLCLNLNGMIDLRPYDGNVAKKKLMKIQPLGSGTHEAAMIRTVIESGYDGPIGVLGHVKTRDVKEVLRENLEGLEYLLGARSKPDWLARFQDARSTQQPNAKGR